MSKLPKFDSCILVPLSWGEGTVLLQKSEIAGVTCDDSSCYNIVLKSAPPILIWDDSPQDRIAEILTDLGWS